MNITAVIGDTPLVEIKSIGQFNPRVKILAKLEGHNPGGSIKDRTALFMIQAAEAQDLLKSDQVILEATSGNTGIALAMIGAVKGYRVKLIMPASVSGERLHILHAHGAEVELTPAVEGTDGAIRRSHQLMKESPGKYFMPDQFSNPSNVRAHFETTGPEIYAQTQAGISHLVAGMGTTGTIMGAGRYLKSKNPVIQVIGVEPAAGHSIQGLKNMMESIVPDIYDPSLLDRKITVEDREAFDLARKLAVREGILAGMSSGAALFGALETSRNLEEGLVVVILPDRGDRYLSTRLFREEDGTSQAIHT